MVKEDCSGTGYEDGQYPFVLYNCAVLRRKTNNETTHFCLLVRLQQPARRSDHQKSHYKRSRVFNDIIVGVKSYIQVSSDSSYRGDRHDIWYWPYALNFVACHSNVLEGNQKNSI